MTRSGVVTRSTPPPLLMPPKSLKAPRPMMAGPITEGTVLFQPPVGRFVSCTYFALPLLNQWVVVRTFSDAESIFVRAVRDCLLARDQTMSQTPLKYAEIAVAPRSEGAVRPHDKASADAQTYFVSQPWPIRLVRFESRTKRLWSVDSKISPIDAHPTFESNGLPVRRKAIIEANQCWHQRLDCVHVQPHPLSGRLLIATVRNSAQDRLAVV